MRVGLVIRTYQPSRAMIDRMLTWIDQLSSSDASIWISVDTSCELFARARSELMQAIENVNGNVNVQMYSECDMEREFPELGKICGLSEQRENWKKYRPNASLAWGFHWEALCLLANDSRFQAQNLDFIWVIEDDVGYTGNLKDLMFGKYGNSVADVITKSLEEVYKDGWVWFNTCSRKFDELIGMLDGGFRYFSAEHVQRFSKRYFDCWIEKTHQGIHAWSEQATPMMCLKLGFILENLSPNDLGTPFSFDGVLNQQEWELLESDPNQQGKLFHALKF